MNSLARIALSTRAMSMVPTTSSRVFAATGTAAAGLSSRRWFGLGDDLKRKEKVEEDRYFRTKEHEAYMARKATESSAAGKVAQKEHDGLTSEIFAILSKTGDKVSDACIENLIDWKQK